MKTAVELLVQEIKSKADNFPTNTKENRIAKGVYVDCLLMAKKAKELCEQERMYNEEEVIQMLMYGIHEARMQDDKLEYQILNETIEQFKKK